MNVKEIQDLKTYLVDAHHNNRLREQKEDQLYIDDKFNVPTIQDKEYIIRFGTANRMSYIPIAHVITNNPQVFVDPIKKSKTSTESADRVASTYNRWARKLTFQTINPYREYGNKLISRGEAWLYIPHNPDWNENDLPCHFIPIDPLVVFVDDRIGEEEGIPKKVIVCYQRNAEEIKSVYPFWIPKNVDSDGNVIIDNDYFTIVVFT